MSGRVQTFDYSVDLMRALLWQYNDAARLQSLLQQKQDWYDENQQGFWENWSRDVFDLRTANDFGLSVWSIILDQPLVADVGASSSTQHAWGFGSHRYNFGHGNFIRGGASTVGLTLEQRRIALQLRYFKLVSRGTVPEINQFLAHLFGSDGGAYVLDSLDMEFAIFVLKFRPSSQLMMVLQEFDLMPRPAGVGVKFITFDKMRWGFGPYRQNFGHGNFAE